MARRVLFVFAWLVVGGEETEVRLLARRLDPGRYRIEVVACFRKPGMPDQTERQLEALGVTVDRTPYTLSFEDTIAYLAGRLPAFDLVVACQAVPDIEPAIRLAQTRGARVPPLIEHGGLVAEAERASGLAARYIGVCAAIRDAAAERLPGREHHAIELPSMVDLAEFDAARRADVRMELGLRPEDVAFGWVGRLDRKKRVEDFLRAAALLSETEPGARYVVIGGPDAFMPEYEAELHRLAADLGLRGRAQFLGDRDDVPRILAGLDALVWLARGEGMPHVIAEAGAAWLPVIVTPDGGTPEQVEDGVSGLFIPHESPASAAAAMRRLVRDPALRRRLGRALRATVEARFSSDVLVPRWEAIFDEVIEEHRAGRPGIERSSAGPQSERSAVRRRSAACQAPGR
jgi:glycosyltransferase involved in cell wall biosynthesis